MSSSFGSCVSATGQGQRARNQAMAGCSLQDFFDPGYIGQRLLHQAQCAAARQAETRCFFLADATGNHGGPVTALAGLDSRNQVILDTAA